MPKKNLTRRRPVRKPLHPEQDLQVSCVEWFNQNYKNYVVYSVPNEAVRSQYGKFKKMGLLAGVSDLVLLFPAGKSVYVELKSDTGVQKRQQAVFERKITNLGFKYFICRSLEEFKEICRSESHRG